MTINDGTGAPGLLYLSQQASRHPTTLRMAQAERVEENT